MEIEELLKTNGIQYEFNVDLKKKTWIHRGGVVSYFITPTDTEQLIILCQYLYSNNLFFELIGNTSNLYFLNDYNPHIVISTVKVNHYLVTENYIVCDCGTNVSLLSKALIKNGLKGFEGLVDLPGTVGGGVYNNSSCCNCSIENLLLKVDMINACGQKVTLLKDELGYTHRSSILKRKEFNGVILRAYFKKEYDDPNKLIVIAEKNHLSRRINQDGPVNNLGSTYCQLFTLGNRRMPFIPRAIMKIENIILSAFHVSELTLNKIKIITILFITGYWMLNKYVSKKNVICFLWKDDHADKYFTEYKEFMRKIYKTNSLEIEIKCKNN